MNVALFLEIKEEYTSHLTDTISPFIYEGLRSLYRNAVDVAREGKNESGQVLLIFQKLLQTVGNWTTIEVDKETNRIKQNSGTSEYLDDLVKAVVKSNIILLSYSNTVSNFIAQSYYNTLTTGSLVHRCYIECAKDAHNNPFLYFEDISPMDYKRNQVIAQQNIQSGIIKGIRKVLPIPLILKEYLANSVCIIDEPKQETKNNPPNENKLDQQVSNLIKVETEKNKNKTENEKIQALMNIDKIITDLDPREKQKMDNNQFGRRQPPSEKQVPYHLLKKNKAESEGGHDNLTKDDKKIINLRMNNTPTPQAASATATSLSGKKNNDVASERINPNEVKYIEEYGSDSVVNSQQNRKKYK